eukprot:COSAG02_NODE_20094_length_848_cov_41795.951936_2_plen_22_part_01
MFSVVFVLNRHLDLAMLFSVLL